MPLKINRLRELRTAAGLTQEELASRASLPYALVTRLDANASVMPRIDASLALARALGVAVDQLICEVLVTA